MSPGRPFTKGAEKIAARQGDLAFFLYHRRHCNEKASATMSVKSRIVSAMKQIAEEQKVVLPPLHDDLSLHETGFDSLAFAILVARLEDDIRSDPFTMSDDVVFPQTVGDFVRAYENVPA
jgi:hypothetical protein